MESLIFGDIFGKANQITFCRNRIPSQPLLFISEDALLEFFRGSLKHGILTGIREELRDTTVFGVFKVISVDDITRVDEEKLNLDENTLILGWCHRADENSSEIGEQDKHPESEVNEPQHPQAQQQEVTPKHIHIQLVREHGFPSHSLRIFIPSENMQELTVSQLEISQNEDEARNEVERRSFFSEPTESTLPYMLYRKADDESFFVDANQIKPIEKSAASDSKEVLRISKEEIAQRSIKTGQNVSDEDEHKEASQPIRIKVPRHQPEKKHNGDIERTKISPSEYQAHSAEPIKKIHLTPQLNNIEEIGEEVLVSLKNRLKDNFRSYPDDTELYLSRKVFEKCKRHPNPLHQKLYGILGGRIEPNRIIIGDILLEEGVKELSRLLNGHPDSIGWCLVEPQMSTYNTLIEHLAAHKKWLTPPLLSLKRAVEHPQMKIGLILQQVNNSIIVIRLDPGAKALVECSKHFLMD